MAVARQWVVLHRVGSRGGAPLDSARTNPAGRYRIAYKADVSDADALYFVSARYAGIAYFSPPLRGAAVRGGDADVTVFDTVHDPSQVNWQGRHLVVSAPTRGGKREVAEIFELENGGTRTLIAKDSASPVWAAALPAHAESVAVAPGGDVSAGSVVFRAGRAELFAPISPGVRQVAITYVLPAGEFPLSVPLERNVALLEVLLEEPRATVAGAKLSEVAAASIDGRPFRRFLAQDVPASMVMRVTAPEPVGQSRTAMAVLGAAVAAVMIAAISIWSRRTRHATRGTRHEEGSVDALIAELAALDARFERGGGDRAAHEAKRAALKSRIEAALAPRQPQP